MQTTPTPVRDLLLVGGGHSHVQVLRNLAMRPLAGVRVTVISREAASPYSGMLPGHVAGEYTRDAMHIDLGHLARRAGAQFIQAEAQGLDPVNRRVLLKDRPPMRYDVLSLNTGAVPVGERDGIAVKPIGRFLSQWQRVLQQKPSSVRVVGTGAGGVELALAIRAALPDTAIALVGRSWLPGQSLRAAKLLRDACDERNIEVQIGTATAESDTGPSLWVTDVRAPAWLGESGLAVDQQGFVQVDELLRSTSHPEIFVAGDVAALPNPRPKSGVFAVRAGPYLVHNLRASLIGGPPRKFRPQRHFLTIIGVGDGTAVASKWGLAVRSKLMWRWKDWIDRRFMDRFKDLPQMPMSTKEVALPPLLAAEQPPAERCGGCGAKLGADLLERVLRQLPLNAREDVLLGIGDDAAEIRVQDSVLLSTDGLRRMLDDTYRMGRIVTHHNLNDIFAMGAIPTSALALATVPLMAEAMMEDELLQLLTGVVDVLRAHDAALVGGHSAEGAELFLGLTVTGQRGAVTFTKGGMQAGDRLVLTKPIGTGVLLAGDMRGVARVEDVHQAVEQMDRSNAAAVPIFRDCGVVAATDVTGFGLLGHLSEMLRASALGASVHIEAIPQLAGAQTLLDGGVSSSLQQNNEQALADFTTSDCNPRLLCDPQTSGGLLAAVPANRVAECLSRLEAAGFERASDIGVVTANEWSIR